MDAPLWKLDELKASGRHQVIRANESLSFAGFRWPRDISNKQHHLVSAYDHPEIFLVLDPVHFGEGGVVVARSDSSTAARRLSEIFDKARHLFIEEPHILDVAVKEGLLKVPIPFYMRLETRLVKRDAFYEEFGSLTFRKTLIHFDEAVMDEYSATDQTCINTTAVRRAWGSVKDFVDLVAPHNCSLRDPTRKRYGAQMEASSGLTTNTPATTPALSHTSTKPGPSRPSATTLPLSKSAPASNVPPLKVLVAGQACQADLKRKPTSPPETSAKPDKKARQLCIPNTSEMATKSKSPEKWSSEMFETMHKILGKAAEHQALNNQVKDMESTPSKEKTPATSELAKENDDLKKQISAIVASSEANEAKLQEEVRGLKNCIEIMEVSARKSEAKQAELQEESRDLKDRIKTIGVSARTSEAKEAELRKELLQKMLEAAGLEADNQRLKKTGSFRQRLELAGQAVEIKQKAARIRDLEETEGAQRRRIEELEALRDVKGSLRGCIEELRRLQSSASDDQDVEEDVRLLRRYVEELKALQVKNYEVKDAMEVEGLLREGIMDLEALLKIRDLPF